MSVRLNVRIVQLQTKEKHPTLLIQVRVFVQLAKLLAGLAKMKIHVRHVMNNFKIEILMVLMINVFPKKDIFRKEMKSLGNPNTLPIPVTHNAALAKNKQTTVLAVN